MVLTLASSGTFEEQGWEIGQVPRGIPGEQNEVRNHSVGPEVEIGSPQPRMRVRIWSVDMRMLPEPRSLLDGSRRVFESFQGW